MLSLYRYMVENNMKDFQTVPDPYNSMLRDEYVARVKKDEMTIEEYEALTKEDYVA
ncbi:hypothetical protein [Schinkia azotoformans]|nr:hypothetical protein [Schinkia azotoformans]MEC1714768.1 hypothetical protein [Schinkia azotoformans]MEC1757476.1 hypothetical protein [Schinkia azotoformans]